MPPEGPRTKARQVHPPPPKEETVHYLVRFLKRNSSEDPRHAEAIKELSGLQDMLLDSYREMNFVNIEQPSLVQPRLVKSMKEGKAVAK